MLRRLIIFLPFLLVSLIPAYSQVKVIRYSDLKKIQNRQDDTTYVINFWATWCKPCVEELPYIDALTSNYSDQKVKVFLVCMDFKRELETKLLPFVKKNNIVSEVLLLDEPDYNSWIPLVDKSWSGAIPATLIFNNSNGVRKFFEQEFTEDEIKKTVKSFIY
jgi:thiol-disulfide isomerase/thioredoxin